MTLVVFSLWLVACGPPKTTDGVSAGVDVQAAATLWDVTVEAKYSALLSIRHNSQSVSTKTEAALTGEIGLHRPTAQAPSWRDRMNNEKWLAGVRIKFSDESNGREEGLLVRRHLQEAGALLIAQKQAFDYQVCYQVCYSTWDGWKLQTSDQQIIYAYHNVYFPEDQEQLFYRALLDDYYYQIENQRLADQIKR